MFAPTHIEATVWPLHHHWWWVTKSLNMWMLLWHEKYLIIPHFGIALQIMVHTTGSAWLRSASNRHHLQETGAELQRHAKSTKHDETVAMYDHQGISLGETLLIYLCCADDDHAGHGRSCAAPHWHAHGEKRRQQKWGKPVCWGTVQQNLCSCIDVGCSNHKVK